MTHKIKRQPPKVGTTFNRKFNGIEYLMLVVKKENKICYEVGGKTYLTPTGAAKSITQMEVNGWRFWKMDKKK